MNGVLFAVISRLPVWIRHLIAGSKRPVVAIDGPAGVGKGTTARLLAALLGVTYLDTGSTYRAVAWECLRTGIDLDEADLVTKVAQEARIEFKNGVVVRINGQDVSHGELRTPETTVGSSRVAQHAGVRQALVRLQREYAQNRGAVVEGRDIGTKVLPEAVKFYLTASQKARARRRLSDQLQGGLKAELEQVARDLARRDALDSERKADPLRPADDAIEIDSTDLTIWPVVGIMYRETRRSLWGSRMFRLGRRSCA